TARPTVPRDLRGALCWSSFPLAVTAMPGLSVAGVLRDLDRQGRAWSGGQPERRLRGCLVAEGGAGLIYLDAGDGAAEQSFTLAHEVAHFLRHYWQPRRRAEEALGPGVLEVLDGLRAPGPRERLHALLRRVPLGCYVHLMDRGPGRSREVDDAEGEADRLALELLAPVAEVRARLGAGAGAARAAALL